MSLRLLHVDDEPDLAELVAIALSLDDSFTLRHCASGAEAIALVREWRPDVLLLDYMLPGMDGPAVLAHLQAEGEPPATIFMTARTAPEDIRRLKELGAVGVIEKPFDPMILSRQVLDLLGHG